MQLPVVWSPCSHCYAATRISHVCTCIPFLWAFLSPSLGPHLGHHRAPSWAPCVTQQLPASHSHFFTQGSVYICQCYSLSSFSAVQFSRSVVSNSLWPHESQHARSPIHHQLPEFTQTHAHQVGDAIQPPHPLLSPSPPAPNPSQHQDLF